VQVPADDPPERRLRLRYHTVVVVGAVAIETICIASVRGDVTASDPTHALRQDRSRTSAQSIRAGHRRGEDAHLAVSAMSTVAVPSHTRFAVPTRRSIGRLATNHRRQRHGERVGAGPREGGIVVVTPNSPTTIAAAADPWSRCTVLAVAHRNKS